MNIKRIDCVAVTLNLAHPDRAVQKSTDDRDPRKPHATQGRSPYLALVSAIVIAGSLAGRGLRSLAYRPKTSRMVAVESD